MLNPCKRAFILSHNKDLFFASANYFGINEKQCMCGILETTSHIYSCESLNQKKSRIEYDRIYNGNLENIKEILTRMKANLETRIRLKSRIESPRDPSDPLYCNQYRFG